MCAASLSGLAAHFPDGAAKQPSPNGPPTVFNSFPSHPASRRRKRWTFGVLTLLLLLPTLILGSAQAGDADRSLQVRTLGACNEAFARGLVTASLGMDQLSGGTLVVSGIPADASVVEAWLYWNGDDDGNNVEDDPAIFNPILHDGDPTITLAGVQVPNPGRVGGPSNWIGVRNVYGYAYRADVSAIVTGNGSYVIGGMDDFTGEQGYNNGVELVVVYQRPNLAPTYIGLGEGLDLISGSNGPNVGPGSIAALFRFAAGLDKRQAQITVFLGGVEPGGETSLWYQTGLNLPPFPDTLQIIGNPEAVEVKNPFDGHQNQNGTGFWDSHTITVTAPAGATWLALQVESKNTQPPQTVAAIDWVGAVVQMPLSCTQKVYLPQLLRLRH